MDYNELISCFQDTIKMSEDELQDATLEAIDNTCVLKENIYEEEKVSKKQSNLYPNKQGESS